MTTYEYLEQYKREIVNLESKLRIAEERLKIATEALHEHNQCSLKTTTQDAFNKMSEIKNEH